MSVTCLALSLMISVAVSTLNPKPIDTSDRCATSDQPAIAKREKEPVRKQLSSRNSNGGIQSRALSPDPVLQPPPLNQQQHSASARVLLFPGGNFEARSTFQVHGYTCFHSYSLILTHWAALLLRLYRIQSTIFPLLLAPCVQWRTRWRWHWSCRRQDAFVSQIAVHAFTLHWGLNVFFCFLACSRNGFSLIQVHSRSNHAAVDGSISNVHRMLKFSHTVPYFCCLRVGWQRAGCNAS